VTETTDTRVSHTTRGLLLAVAAGVVVTVVVWLLARQTAAGSYSGGGFRLFFSTPFYLKAWLATAALVVAASQPLTGPWLFGKLPWRRPPWLAPVHRIAGWLIYVLTLPVAYLCVFEAGFSTSPARALVHSILGCALYGAFTAKVIVVHVKRSPYWAFALSGGLVFVLLLAVWWVSALWLFRTIGVQL
jgi:hypothetical protein